MGECMYCKHQDTEAKLKDHELRCPAVKKS